MHYFVIYYEAAFDGTQVTGTLGMMSREARYDKALIKKEVGQLFGKSLEESDDQTIHLKVYSSEISHVDFYRSKFSLTRLNEPAM